MAGGVPAGPAIQQTEADAGVRAIRTYQDLLKNEADARLFDYYANSQPTEIGLDGQSRAVGTVGVYLGLSLSPDGGYLLSQRVHRPYSYVVPVSSFPRRIEVLERSTGKLVHTVAVRPLVEGLPTGNDAEVTGVRDISWRGDADATLVWAEAQDGGDPNRDAKVRDAVLMQAAPFDKPPATLAQLGSRLAGISWGRGDLALLTESWWKTRRSKTWLIAPDNASADARLLWDRDAQDRYADPGRPLMASDDRGRSLLQTTADGGSLYLAGAGASPEGDRPFLDRLDLGSLKSERLFRSSADAYEQFLGFSNTPGRYLTWHQSVMDPPNAFVRQQGERNAAAKEGEAQYASTATALTRL